MKKLYFFTTEGCHLCDQAEQLLLSITSEITFECEVVDIAESDELIKKYGTKIPVLKKKENHEEKNWPFNQAQIIQWLS